MGLEGQMRVNSATGKVLPSHTFSAEMIAPACDGGTGGPGTFVARDFTLDEVPEGARISSRRRGFTGRF